jgi:tetratricopeptide (TPR) repeat protein
MMPFSDEDLQEPVSDLIDEEFYQDLFQKAIAYFEIDDFDSAILYFSLVLDEVPEHKEAKFFAVLSDFAKNNTSHAKSLFDFYMVSEQKQKEDIRKYIYDIIKNTDESTYSVMSLLQEFRKMEIEAVDAVDYTDLLDIVRQNGSFKEVFEGIMFSTKVAIKSQDELLDFIEKLVENGFEDIAEEYLEQFNISFSDDHKLKQIYDKLDKTKNLENNKIEEKK